MTQAAFAGFRTAPEMRLRHLARLLRLAARLQKPSGLYSVEHERLISASLSRKEADEEFYHRFAENRWTPRE